MPRSVNTVRAYTCRIDVHDCKRLGCYLARRALRKCLRHQQIVVTSFIVYESNLNTKNFVRTYSGHSHNSPKYYRNDHPADSYQ
jgi:hypothetical protein